MRGFRGRHFLTVQDYSKEELMEIIHFSIELKRAAKRGYETKLLKGKHLAMIFEEPSTRTRVSFEVGIAQLGGTAIFLKPGDIHLGARESIGDTTRVLSSMVDGIVTRLYKHTDLLEIAKHSSVPIINGLTDIRHPSQALADAMTIYETLGTFENIKVSFFGDASCVCNSLVLICSILGINLTVATPAKYAVKEDVRSVALAHAARSGARIEFVQDPERAVDGSDIVYTDIWWWVDQEHEAADRSVAMQSYQVTPQLMARAKPGARFMHCLPASRKLEATDEVLDAPYSIIFAQAENRLHAQKGLMALLLQDGGPDLPDEERACVERLKGRMLRLA